MHDDFILVGARKSKAGVSHVIGDFQLLILLLLFIYPLCERSFKLHQGPRFKELSVFQVLKMFNTSKIVFSWSSSSGQRQLCFVVLPNALFLEQQVSP